MTTSVPLPFPRDPCAEAEGQPPTANRELRRLFKHNQVERTRSAGTCRTESHHHATRNLLSFRQRPSASAALDDSSKLGHWVSEVMSPGLGLGNATPSTADIRRLTMLYMSSCNRRGEV